MKEKSKNASARAPKIRMNALKFDFFSKLWYNIYIPKGKKKIKKRTEKKL